MHACTLSRRMLGRRRIHLSYEEEEDTCMHACMYFVLQDAGNRCAGVKANVHLSQGYPLRVRLRGKDVHAGSMNKKKE
jgi:hypothetical protein